MAVYTRWMAYQLLTLEESRQASQEWIHRVSKKGIFPLKRLTIYEITRPQLLEAS